MNASAPLGTFDSRTLQGANFPAVVEKSVGTPAESPKPTKDRRSLERSTWLTVEQATKLTGHTKQAIQTACKDGRLVTKMVDGNGGKQYRIRLDSLPEVARLRWWLRRLGADGAVEELAPEIPEKNRRVALARADLLRMYLLETEEQEGVSVTMAKRFFAARYAEGEWPELKEVLGDASLKTIERWKKQLRDAGGDPLALAPRYRQKSGTEARAITPAQGESLLHYLLMGNRLRISEVIRQARKEWDDLGIEHDVSDKTIRRWINDWKKENADTWEYMRNGRKAWNERVSPYIIRKKEAVEVGDLVVADGHVLNFRILHPSTGKPVRMTLLMIYDFRANLPLGWEIMPTENTQCIASAYRRAILRLGFVPRVFYLDNGRAFRARFFKGTSDFQQAGFTGLFDRLGSKVIHAWPYHGQSKTVERFFGAFSELERLQPSYIGTSIEAKPARLSRGEKVARELAESLSTTTPTLLDAHRLIAEWCDEYCRRPQEKALHGLTPYQVADQSLERVRRSDDFEGREISEPQLRLLMMEQEVRRIERNGIRWRGEFYWHDAFATLERGRNDSFRILYDWDDVDKIVVMRSSGEFVGIAERVTAQHPAARHLGTNDDVLALEKAIDHRKGLEAQTVSKVRHLAAALYPTTENELPATPEKKSLPPEPVEPIDWSTITPEAPQTNHDEIALFECDRGEEEYGEGDEESPVDY